MAKKPSLLQGSFHVELSGLRFVTGYNGRMLRADLTLACKKEDGTVLGHTTQGCLVVRDRAGRLQFHPPTTTTKGGGRLAAARVTPALADLVVGLVKKSKYEKYIGETFPIKDPDLPGDLPEELSA